jgi:hypothetical protein
MRIRYTGQCGVRRVGEYRWDRANAFVVEIADDRLAADLITQEGFEIAGDDPLAQALGTAAASEILVERATAGAGADPNPVPTKPHKQTKRGASAPEPNSAPNVSPNQEG